MRNRTRRDEMRMSRTTVAGVWAGLALLGAFAGAVAQEGTAAGAEREAAARAEARATGLPQAAPGVEVAASAITLSSRADGRAELLLELESGREHRISLEDGAVRIDGETVGAYREDGRLGEAWRSFLREQLGRSDADLGERLLAWRAGPLPEGEGAAATALYEGIARTLGVPPEPSEPTATADLPAGGQVSIAPGGVGFSDLARELERLQEALGDLGEAARDAGTRLALIVHDDYAVPAERTVEGNVALLDGTLRLGGTVSGDVLVLDGDLVLGEGARVAGNILQVGGDVELEGGVVEGEILADLAVERAEPSGRAVVEPVAPAAPRAPRAPRHREWGPFDRLSHNMGHAVEGVLGTLSAFLAFAVIALLFVYFARGRLETVADTVRHEFARSFAMGLAGQVLFFPALLVLCVLVITIPVIPFFILGTGLALLAGYIAVAHGAGEMFAQRRYRYEWLERLRRSNSYYYVLSGLALLLLPFAVGSLIWVFGGLLDFLRGIVFFVAAVGTWVLVTAGFGSVLLTRAGSRSIVVDWAPEEVDLSGGAPAGGGEARGGSRAGGESPSGPGGADEGSTGSETDRV